MKVSDNDAKKVKADLASEAKAAVRSALSSDMADDPVANSPLETGLWFLVPGLLQGLALYFIIEGVQDTESPFTVALAFFFAVAPIAHFLTTCKGNRLSAAIFSVALGVLTASLYYLAQVSFGGDTISPQVLGLSLFCNGIIAYVAGPFFRTIFERKEAPNHYPSLFAFAWNLPVVGGCAAIFLGAVWVVLFLWAQLFDLIGIGFFEDLFFDKVTAWPITFGALGLGVGVVRQRESLVLALRSVLFALLKVIAPIFAVATVMFTISAFATGLDELWSGWSATTLMVSAVALAILLINAVVGDDDRQMHPVLSSAVRFQSFVLPFLAGFALYGIYIRIQSYGLTVERIYAFILVAIASAYAGAYCISALFPRSAGFLRQANVVLAGVVFVSAVLVQTPVMNFQKMSADNQIARLKAGKVSAKNFDYGYLKFQLGKAGENALTQLAADETLAERDIVIAEVAAVNKATSRYRYRQSTQEDSAQSKALTAFESGKIPVYGQEGDLPEAVMAQILNRWNVGNCGSGDHSRCAVVAVSPVREKPGLDYLLFTQTGRASFDVSLIIERDAGWQTVGGGNRHFADKASLARFFSSLAQGDYRTSEVRLRSVIVGDEVIIPGLSHKSWQYSLIEDEPADTTDQENTSDAIPAED